MGPALKRIKFSEGDIEGARHDARDPATLFATEDVADAERRQVVSSFERSDGFISLADGGFDVLWVSKCRHG